DVNFRYPSLEQYEQATRTMVATLQYTGLDLVTRAIPIYAKNLGWSKSEFETYSHGMVGNWCSQNLTLVSHKELKRNLISNWDNPSDFKLPSIIDNNFFPQKLLSLSS